MQGNGIVENRCSSVIVLSVILAALLNRANGSLVLEHSGSNATLRPVANGVGSKLPGHSIVTDLGQSAHASKGESNSNAATGGAGSVPAIGSAAPLEVRTSRSSILHGSPSAKRKDG